MLVNNLRIINILKKTIKNDITIEYNKNYYLDLNKHYPLFKLFDLADIIETSFTSNISYDSFINIVTLKKDKNYLYTFLHEKRTNSLCLNSKMLSYKGIYNIISSYEKLLFYKFYNNTLVYGTGTLGVDDKFLILLCIKPEYIYYVKLCYLANKEIEFDCFYILYRKDAEIIIDSNNNNNFLKKMLFNNINKLIKNYGVNVIKVDSIEVELNYNIILPKFTTMKDYHAWLNNIESNFIKSLQNE